MMANSCYIKKDDKVKILVGKDKGKIGKVLTVNRKNSRVLVEKINMVKRHSKPSAQSKQGGIIEKEMPLARSNVMLFNPITEKGDRVGIKTLEDGRKVRFYKSNNEVVDV